MARRKPFEEYRITKKDERIKERIILTKMIKTDMFQIWLIRTFYFQHNECYYCDEQIFYPERLSYHIDHRIPVYYGGKSEYHNLCLACPSCNLTKGTQQLIRNKAFLNKINRHRPKPVIYL
jgi:5-methylcytosine-specific restriction endonuclease McrA